MLGRPHRYAEIKRDPGQLPGAMDFPSPFCRRLPEKGADRINEILEPYNRASGQLVNKKKSAVFVSENCDQDAKQMVHAKLEIPTEVLGEKYLGLPTAVGKVADGAFNYVSDRIRGFVQGWSENLLSCAGREVLLKANA